MGKVGKIKLGNFSFLLVIFVIFWKIHEKKTEAAIDYASSGDRPSLTTNEGHLLLSAASDHNITFKTTGKGYVNINGENLVHLVRLARNASETVERLRLTKLADLERITKRLNNLISGPTGLMSRMANLEFGSNNSSMSGGQGGGGGGRNNNRGIIALRTRVNTLTRRVYTLERQVRDLRTLLTSNECASNPCRNGGTCEDHFNGFVCRCPTNWEGPWCETDVNECARFVGTDLGCQNGATCVNKPGTYECVCQVGWFGIHCTQHSNDCSSASSQELCGNGVCVNQVGTTGYTCICKQGWTTEVGGKACTKDVDECASNNPPCSRNPMVECVNIPGAFFCKGCPQGFTGNGFYCTDINECQDNNGGCSSLVQCVNTYGSRVCSTCPPGYQGDGVTCSYQGGACRTNNGGCHPMATCQDNSAVSSSFVTCSCPVGFAGTGIGPAGCHPVSSSGNVNPCLSNPCLRGLCLRNNIGTYRCRCPPGFSGSLCEVVVDGCASAPCLNGATCLRRPAGGFKCNCSQGFSGETCANQNQECGGVFNDNTGSLKFPTSTGKYHHSLSCGWVINVNSSYVINVTFKSFGLEQSPDCLYDWLQINDGRTASDHPIGKFCGQSLPNGGNIVSTSNNLYIWFRSDQSNNHDGFELEWNATVPVCGGLVETSSHGLLSSPGSPGKYPPNRDCLWKIAGPLNKRLQFSFYTLMLAPSTNCSQDWLQIHDGLDSGDPVLVKFCNTSHPAPLTTAGHAALVHFHSDATGSASGFQLIYAVIEGFPGCGGVLTGPVGDIISPRDPMENGYKKALDCEWQIRLGSDEKIVLSFESFDLEVSTSCNFDYLELREGADAKAPLIGKYCGTESPRTYTSQGNVLYIKFHTDWSLAGEGFHIKYKTLCGGIYETPEGTIKSPLYPNPYPNSRTCEYLIKQPLGRAIKLQFLDFDIEDTSYPNCIFDNLKVHDGDSENSTLIGTYCGEDDIIPPDAVSTFNYLWLQFNTDSSDRNRGFHANYSTIDARCGGILKEPMGVITSPSHPEMYPHDIRCSWVIVAKPGHIIQLQFISISLEFHPTCKRDYVEVFDNSSMSSEGGSMGRYCSGTPPTLTSSDNMMTIIFVTDSSIAREGFTANYFTLDATKMCGSNYFTTAGRIKSPGYPNQYPHHKECTWVITVPQGQQIMLNMTDFELEANGECKFDFLEIRNGAYETSPLVGRFCGTIIPPIIPSLSNQLFLRFKSDGSQTAKGFLITWDGTTTGCGGTLTAPTGTIMTPNYPQSYGRNAECFWKVVVNAGSTIQLIFNDLDLEPHSKCRMDYVELYEGVDSSGQLIGRYCSTHPATVITKGNQLYMKFRSDVSQEGRGFSIKYMAVCTTTVTGYRGVIESPNFPNPYPADKDCTWTIAAPKGNKLNLTFSHFAMESDLQPAKSCKYDYLEVTEGKLQEPANSVLGRFCSSTLPPPISSTKDHVYVHFVSDASVGENGFRIEWVLNGCGGEFTHPNGEFKSPGYPGAYPESVTCEWLITLDLGHSVELNISDLALERSRGECSYDGLTIYGGPDDTSPKLGHYCHNQKNITLTSSGNSMFVRFYSDFSYSGRGFKALYRSVPSRCGGKFSAPSGVLHSRNYPLNYDKSDDCLWFIEVNMNHVVRLTFTSFDIEAHHNCSMDYVRVFDGDNLKSPKLIDHCGNTLPSPSEVISSSNKLLVRFKSDASVSAKGFLANYSISCGARIVTDDSGFIQTDDALNVHSHIERGSNCSWIIIGAKPNDRVTLTITHLDVSASNAEEGQCEYYHVNIHDGDDKDAPLMGSYCGNKAPPHITSHGNAMFVQLVSEYGGHYGNFFATYSVLTAACGGNLTSEHGSFATPNYPDNYPPNVECIWTINASPGNRAIINFPSFDITPSDFCNDDYVEVREVDGVGPLIGVYCTSIPGNVTAANKLWVKFKSNGDGNAKGFIADYSLLHGNEITGSSGQIASPLYPKPYIQTGDFNWRITVRFGYAISITFRIFNMDKAGSVCEFFLGVYDGYDDTAPELLKACGSNLVPDPITSTSNVVYLRLSTDPLKQGTLFLLHWLQVDKNKPKAIGNPVNASGCDAIIDLRNKTTAYELTSPGYPYGYKNRLDCQWIFETNPGFHIALRFTSMDLEQSSTCNMDNVQVYRGKQNSPDWRLLKTLCLPNATHENVLEATSLMKVVFHTDSLKNETGFAANVFSVCGGLLTDPNGVIEANNNTVSKGTPRSYRDVICQWNVTVRAGRKIAVTFTRFDLSSSGGETTCGEDAFIMLKNGRGEDSPLLGNGKYCGSTIPTIPETTSNKLFIKFKAPIHSKGFRLEYQEVSQSCGGNIMLTQTFNVRESVTISSPNYPNIPPPHIECIWVIMAPAGERLHIEFVDRFDISRSNDCNQAAVVLRDGGTQNSRILGEPYCMDMPSSVYTTGNMLYVRFFTDVTDPKNGFKANITLGTCGGTIRDIRGSVSSPNYPGTYPANTDCQWRVVGPKGHLLNFQIQDMYFMVKRGNCSLGDYITIDEVVPGNNTDSIVNSLGMFCQSNRLNETIRTSANEAVVKFHAGPANDNNPLTRFKLVFNSSKEVCGETLNTPSGVMQSLNYPSGEVYSRFCQWKITVPVGRRITLKVLDLDVESSSYGYGRVMFYNDLEYRSRITMYNSTSLLLPVMSSSNTMLVHLWVKHNVAHRGFKASYTSDKPTVCVGDFNSTSGVIQRPQNITVFHCKWEHVRSPDINQTLALVLTVTTIGQKDVLCQRSQSAVSVTALGGKLRLGDFCGNITTPVIVRSPFAATTLTAFEGFFHGSVDFQIRYQTSPCGGQLKGPVETVSSPGFPSNYPKDTDCAWSVEYPSGQTIKVHFNSLDFEPGCDKDYLVIYNGPSPSSPVIGKYCGNTIPVDIKSQSNQLWIDFHSDSNNQRPGFQLTLEPIISGCGGIFHAQSGEMSTPQFPEQYPNNAECEWELRAESGYSIQLVFVERFSLEKSLNCENDFVEVYDFVSPTEEWKKLGRFCDRTAPDTLNSTGSQMKVLFRSNGATAAEGFKARWNVKCGGLYDGLSKGRIVSPGYPKRYAGSLRCNYTITAQGRQIVAKFLSFSLETGYNRECRYDNLTLHGYLNVWSREMQSLGTYCGSDKPPDRVFRNKLTLDFRTDQYVESRGFAMEYELSSCGGEVTAPGLIKMSKGAYDFLGPMNCTWIITAPADNIIVIRFSSLELEHSYRCHYDSVEVYEGSLVNETALIGQFCGNLSSSLPVTKSSTNRVVVSLSLVHQRDSFQMSADILFMYGEKVGCGGKVSVSPSATTLRSPGTTYKPFLDCHWLLTAPDSQTVSLQLTSLGIAPCYNRTFNATTGCRCDFLEVRDGSSQFSELIGRYCSEQPNGPIVSSSNKMWVRFASDGVNEAPGFTASVMSALSICGESVLNVTNDTQTLTSPNWPANYPPNLRCRWQLYSGMRNVRVAVHFQEIQLDDSDDCADRLTFTDVGNSHFINQGLGEDSIRYSGQPSRPVSIYRGSRSPTSAVQFCGSPSQLDYYSDTGEVAVTFTSNQQKAAKGFKMSFTAAGCTRNYTGPQGRILVEQLPEHCYIVIHAKPNHTISLYFTSFQIFSSQDCGTRALEIRDGTNGNAPLLAKVCGYELPSPVFSNGSDLHLHSWRPMATSFEHFDITYTTTDQGQGCGGTIFNYGGTFSSPMYPKNLRKATVCRWDISVPYGTTPALKFMVFDLGSKSTCSTDFVELLDVDTKTGQEYVRTRYCGEDNPAVYLSEMNTVAVRYTTSVHNGGTGWLIRFMGRVPGSTIANFK